MICEVREVDNMSGISWPEWIPSRGIQQREWSFACIGPGRVGSALSRALAELGFPPVAVGGGGSGAAEELAQELGAQILTEPYSGLGDRARLIVVTPPDSELDKAAAALGEGAGIRAGACVLQTSATLTASTLEPAAAGTEGVHLLSLHPMKPFPDRDRDLRHFADLVIGVEAVGKASAFGDALALLLGGNPIQLTPDVKGEYHAAGVMAFTGIMALAGAVGDLAEKMGLDKIFYEKGILPGMKAAIEAVESRGLPDALTGPVSRGDVEVVAQHLEELNESMPGLVPLYRELARINVRVASDGGLIDQATVRIFNELLDSYS